MIPGDDHCYNVPGALAQVCALSPLDREGRYASVGAILRQATALLEEDKGIRIEWGGSDEIAAALLAFVLAERRCCGRFSYEISFAPGRASTALRIRAALEEVASLKAIYLGCAAEVGLHAR